MATKLNQLKVGFYGAIAWVFVIAALWLATPANLKPIGVTLWFLFLALGLCCILALIIDAAKRLFGPKKAEGRSFEPSLRQGVLLGLWATILLAMSSLRQLSLRDTLLSAILIIIIEIYLRLSK